MSIDERLLRVARTCGHTPALEWTVRRFSLLGEHAGVWIAIGAAQSLLVDEGEGRACWRRATAVVATTYALNTALKLIVRRTRPQLVDLPPLAKTPTRYSFPSAHASTSFAAALAYSRAGLPAFPLYSLAKAMAFSRLYLGVHYPSDILAGAALGTAVAAAFTRPAPPQVDPRSAEATA